MTNKTYMQGNSDVSSEKIIAIFMNLIHQMKLELEPHQTQNTSIPAAPNTAKFMASVSGKVSLEKNVTIHGVYNSYVTYDSFLKIGSGIKHNITMPIKSKFMNSFQEELGTNCGGVGLKVS